MIVVPTATRRENLPDRLEKSRHDTVLPLVLLLKSKNSSVTKSPISRSLIHQLGVKFQIVASPATHDTFSSG